MVHFKLVKENGCLYLVACNAGGSIETAGYLIKIYPDGHMTRCAGVSSSLGLQLEGDGRILEDQRGR